MKRLMKTALGALALGGAALSAACQPSAGEKKAETAAPRAAELQVKAEPAATRDWIISVPVSGSLRSQSLVDVKAEVGGRLTDMSFREGDLVRQGELLAEIDAAGYRLAYEQAAAAVGVAEAGLARAEVAADHARKEQERADNLLRSGGITEKEREAAVNGVRDSESQVKLAQAQIRQARAAAAVAAKVVSDCRIPAPAGGMVQRRFLDPGTIVAPGAPLYTLVDNGRLELECLVPSYRLAELHQGQRCGFTTPTWGERRFQGTVAAINPMVESDSRSIKILVRIANSGGELRTGMFARGEIEVRREPGALVVPRTALMVEQEGSAKGALYVVQEGRARRREVEVAGIQMDRVRIRSGLQAGEVVITEIGPALKNEASVAVMPPQAGGR